MDYEIKKAEIELQIVREKRKLFPDNVAVAQKEIELVLRLFKLTGKQY